MSPVWHDGPLATLEPVDARAVVWSVPEGTNDRHAARLRRRDLAATLIACVADVPVSHVRISRSAAGAPRVDAPDGWHLSLSSRAGRCLIGVARAPIGVDREATDAEEPLWDMLTAAERDDLRALAADRQPRAWLRRWTIKEAHAKLVGEPRRIAPTAIETRLADTAFATACFEGHSRCWTRETGDAIETVALWDDGR